MDRPRRSRITLLLMVLASGLFGPHLRSISAVETDERLSAALAVINDTREEHGLAPLRNEPAAAAAAVLHAEELGERMILSHRGRDGSRVNERYRRQGGTGLRSGEILGAGENLEQIMNGWMHSTRHRESLLNPRWTGAGVGIRNLDGGRIVIAVVFSGSCWRGISMAVEGESVVLTGSAVELSDEHPGEPSLLVDGRIVTPAAIESGLSVEAPLRAVTFLFPVPEAWEKGGIASAFFSIQGVDNPSDLILLPRP